MPLAVREIAYLIATACFIFGLKMMSHPSRARRGNLIGALGMLLAVVITLLDLKILNWVEIVVGMVVGSTAGLWLAYKVEMTAMPQMVAILNGFGGLASTLVAGSEFSRSAGVLEPTVSVSIGLSIVVGGLTFTGSMVAFAKLQGLLSGKPILWPMQKHLNAVLLMLGLFLTAMVAHWTAPPDGIPIDQLAGIHRGSGPAFAVMVCIAISFLLGVTSTIPIGGADMPVVISLLNSYSGIAASMTGFVLGNHMLIVTGALVGASGLILTNIMCKGMNRSLANVLFAGVGTDAGPVLPGAAVQGTMRAGSPEEAAIILANARQVVFVPGYGMAVAQAQHAVRDVAEAMQKNGTVVKYAIHPVAGRMPGHMNILLAEAKVPYEQLFDMDQINSEFENTDVAIIIGANDVVNPAARTERSSPIYGMPILDVDRSRTIMVVKRGMGAGFSGVENPLFLNPKTMMLFGDAKKVMTSLQAALREHS